MQIQQAGLATPTGRRSRPGTNCRLNLVRECGLTAAERFTGEWEALTGNRYHPGAEVALLVDLLGETEDAPAEHFGVYEKLLGAALAAL